MSYRGEEDGVLECVGFWLAVGVIVLIGVAIGIALLVWLGR